MIEGGGRALLVRRATDDGSVWCMHDHGVGSHHLATVQCLSSKLTLTCAVLLHYPVRVLRTISNKPSYNVMKTYIVDE